MAATEEFVQRKVQEAEERWKDRLDKEIAKFKEDMDKIKTNQATAGTWKDKSQIEQYKDKFALRKKDAVHEKPTVKLNDDNFTEFKQQMTGWMKALHPVIKKVIDNLERPENRTVDEADMKKRLIDEMREQAEEKYKINIQDSSERQERAHSKKSGTIP